MTIRFKLIMAAIAIVVVANSILALVAIEYLEHRWLNEVQNRVRLDLNSARASYDSYLAGVARFLEGVALDQDLGQGLKKPQSEESRALLRRAFQIGQMDLLVVTDAKGKVIYRAQNSGQRDDSLADNPLVADAIREKRPAMGSLSVPAVELAREGKELAERARITLVPTTASLATDEKVRNDGMIVAAAVPLLGDKGQLLGVLYGGNLLNRRDALVDSIRQSVFPSQLDSNKSIGTVTLFQGDLRIATNVLSEDGSRAVGTRLSETVCDEVLQRGGTWAAPAFVVRDWYITAYEPIRDPRQRIIGALYVGLLQAPFVVSRVATTIHFLLMMIVTTVVSLGLIYTVTMLVMRPVGRIVSMSRKVIAGDMTARVGIRPPGELGLLCQAIDAMAEAVARRETQLTQAARQQVSRAEKLASIGRLAAGVAHEINNPLTGVLTFAHLLRHKPHMSEEDHQDLDLIIHETTRAAEIVRGLLDFARERPTKMEPLDINDVVRRTVRLIANQKKFEHIVIEEVLQDGLPEVCGDMNPLQQVLLNLALNACTAMPNGGRLTITTTASNGRVILRVADTGCGIKDELLEMIFEPFFTTQPVGKGTGLGLSVTFGIVEQHNGTLEVQSKEGQGSTFIISLPALTL